MATPSARTRACDGRVSLFLLAALLLISGGAAFALIRLLGADAASAPGRFDPERRRAWAGKLLAEGLREEAALVYEALIASPDVDLPTVAAVSFSIAKIHIEDHRYEKALAALYRAEIATTDDGIRAEIGRLVVHCLAKLGRDADARHALRRAAAADPRDAGPGGAEVLAEAGDLVVTRAELDQALARVPGHVAARLEDADSRRKIVEGLLAEKIIHARALAVGLEKDPDLRAATEEAARRILVRKLLADEVASRVRVEGSDVKLYFEARRATYRIPARARLRHIALDGRDQADAVLARIRGGEAAFVEEAARVSLEERTSKQGGLVEPDPVENEPHPLFPNVREVLDLAARTGPGRLAEGTLQAGGRHHLVLVESFDPGRDRGFHEVKDDVERDYRAEREQAALAEVFEASLRGAGARVHVERLGSPAESRPESR